MNCDFPKKLATARKKRGISQKQAAAALGVSQALLSHYEKGIRECGLDFVVKVSKYYGVSCDYLLGISDEADTDDRQEIVRVLSTVLSVLSKTGGAQSEKYCKTYVDLAVYRLLRILVNTPAGATYQTDRMADGYMQLCIARLMNQFKGEGKDTEAELKGSADWNAISSVISSSESLLADLNFESK